jgi:hypothetical protein
VTTASIHGASDAARDARRRKLIGLAFLGLPATLFVAFAVGEGIGGEEGWWGHLLQLAIAVLLAVGAWVRPRLGGSALIVVGALFAAWLLATDGGLPGAALGLVIVAAPLIIAGVLFARAGVAAGRVS